MVLTCLLVRHEQYDRITERQSNPDIFVFIARSTSIDIKLFNQDPSFDGNPLHTLSLGLFFG